MTPAGPIELEGGQRRTLSCETSPPLPSFLAPGAGRRPPRLQPRAWQGGGEAAAAAAPAAAQQASSPLTLTLGAQPKNFTCRSLHLEHGQLSGAACGPVRCCSGCEGADSVCARLPLCRTAADGQALVYADLLAAPPPGPAAWHMSRQPALGAALSRGSCDVLEPLRLLLPQASARHHTAPFVKGTISCYELCCGLRLSARGGAATRARCACWCVRAHTPRACKAQPSLCPPSAPGAAALRVRRDLHMRRRRVL